MNENNTVEVKDVELLDSSERNSINNANESEKESVVKKKGKDVNFHHPLQLY